MYDGKFNENTLIVGQTGCNKTTFTQNLAKNKMFAKLKEIFWLSKIMLSQDREQDTLSCFDLKVNPKYPQTLNDFNTVTDTFMNTFHTETFGSIDYTLKHQILPKKND